MTVKTTPRDECRAGPRACPLCTREDGRAAIEVANCLLCHQITIAPDANRCDCGGEFDPLFRLVALGEAVSAERLSGWSNDE